jgi:hypothetical protein
MGDTAPGFDLEALIEAIRTALSGFLGGPAPEGQDGEPAPRAAWPRPERDGRSFGDTASAGRRAASNEGRPGPTGGSATSRSGGGFLGGSVDLSGGLGLGLGVGSMLPGVGIAATLANLGLRTNNMLEAQQMLEEAGLPGYDFGQWVGGLSGGNSYASGSPYSPIGYTADGTAITPSGYQYGTDGFFGPVLDLFGVGDGWSTAIDPHSAGLEAEGVTHHNVRQMPTAMTSDLRTRSAPSTGTGGSANSPSGRPNVSAHDPGGAGYTQHARAPGSGGGASPSSAGAAGRTTAQVVR